MKKILFLLVLLTINNLFAEVTIHDLKIKNINKNIYLHKSYKQTQDWGMVSSNGLVVVNGTEAYIIDTPWSEKDTIKLVNWIKNQGYNLAGSISTHSHDDRSSGIKWLNSNSIPTYVSRLTNQLLEKEGKTLAENSFEQSEFWMVKDKIQAFYPGGGHTIDNIVVWLSDSKILFGGCLVRSKNSKSLGYTEEASIDIWADSIEKIIAKYPDIKMVVPGHGASGSIELLEHTKNMARKAADK